MLWTFGRLGKSHFPYIQSYSQNVPGNKSPGRSGMYSVVMLNKFEFKCDLK
jgi:hypothetical protein